jgi:hypothetical protein
MARGMVGIAGRMLSVAATVLIGSAAALAQIQQTPATTLEAAPSATTLTPGATPAPPPTMLLQPGVVEQTLPALQSPGQAAPPMYSSPLPLDRLDAQPKPPVDPDMPKDTRNGMFQKLIFDADWLAGGGAHSLGMADFSGRCMLALPLPSRDWPLLITPGFSYHLLDAPAAVDLPDQVYGANVEFRWLPKLNDQWRLDLEVLPGWYGDYKQSNNKGLRITYYGAAIWTFNGRDKIVLGASYRDRADTPVIPIAGLMWRPYPDLKADLLFPEPKISHRVYWFGNYGDEQEDWAYVSGEFADDVYAYQRGNGLPDSFSYRDIRLLLGLEHKAIGRLDWRVDVGYVFDRRIRTLSNATNYDATSTIMLRGGLVY